MEKALLSNQANTQTDDHAAMLAREMRRMGDMLYTEANWLELWRGLIDEANFSEISYVLREVTDHAEELLDWMKIHRGTLTKKNKEISSKAE